MGGSDSKSCREAEDASCALLASDAFEVADEQTLTDDDEEHDMRCIKRQTWQCISAITDPTSEKYILNVNSTPFTILVASVITFNALVIGLETDLGEAHFTVAEQFCTLFFVAEMLLRLRQLGVCEYFGAFGNVFDCFLVSVGVLDIYVLPYVANDFDSSAIGALRLLRMFRILRIVRLFSILSELQIILNAFCKAFHSVLWVGTLLLILDYVCAIFLTQMVGQKAFLWGPDEAQVVTWFGSVGQSMRTLCFIMTLSEWDTVVLTLSRRLNGVVVLVAATGYIIVTAYTMLSLITGVICEALVTARRQDEEQRLETFEEGQRFVAATLRDLLLTFDADGSGSLNHDEVRAAVEGLESGDNKLCKRLEALDIRMDVKAILGLVDRMAAEDPSAEGEIRIEDIADAMCHLSGGATAHAVWEVKHEVRSCRREYADISGTVQQLKADVAGATQKLDQLCTQLLPSHPQEPQAGLVTGGAASQTGPGPSSCSSPLLAAGVGAKPDEPAVSIDTKVDQVLAELRAIVRPSPRNFDVKLDAVAARVQREVDETLEKFTASLGERLDQVCAQSCAQLLAAVRPSSKDPSSAQRSLDVKLDAVAARVQRDVDTKLDALTASIGERLHQVYARLDQACAASPVQQNGAQVDALLAGVDAKLDQVCSHLLAARRPQAKELGPDDALVASLETKLKAFDEKLDALAAAGRWSREHGHSHRQGTPGAGAPPRPGWEEGLSRTGAADAWTPNAAPSQSALMWGGCCVSPASPGLSRSAVPLERGALYEQFAEQVARLDVHLASVDARLDAHAAGVEEKLNYLCAQRPAMG